MRHYINGKTIEMGCNHPNMKGNTTLSVGCNGNCVVCRFSIAEISETGDKMTIPEFFKKENVCI